MMAGTCVVFQALARQCQGRDIIAKDGLPILGGCGVLRCQRVVLALPLGVVGVLDGRARQGPAWLAKGACQVVHQDRIGPGVRDDVMHIEQQHIILRGALEQGATNQRRLAQVEGLGGMLADAILHLLFALDAVQGAQVLFEQVQLCALVDDL